MEPELSYLGMGWMIIFATDGSDRKTLKRIMPSDKVFDLDDDMHIQSSSEH
jgi:hypothetical protein